MVNFKWWIVVGVPECLQGPRNHSLLSSLWLWVDVEVDGAEIFY